MSSLPLTPLTPWQAFVNRWGNCTSCKLHETRKHIVLARGTLPCDVLFCGEAPGSSEDAIGKPFIGPAGHKLDAIIANSVPPEVRLAFCNLVMCLPKDENGDKGQPSSEEIAACAPRLSEFIRLAQPKLLVCVGDMARDYLEQGYKYSVEVSEDIPQVHITHPAAVLRAPLAHRGLLTRRCEVQLANAIEKYILQELQ